FEFGFRFLEEYHAWLAFLPAVVRKPDCRVYCFPLYGKESFQVTGLDHPLIVSLKHEELDDRAHLSDPTDCRDHTAHPIDVRRPTQGESIAIRPPACSPRLTSKLKFHACRGSASRSSAPTR